MRPSIRRVTATAIMGMLVVACAAATPPSATPIPTGSTATATTAPVSATPGPTTDAIASPSLDPVPRPATLDIRGSAREVGEQIRLAAGPNGTVFVAIPQPDGWVLVLLDRSGQPRPGWPIRVEHSRSCPLMFPVDDGSVRIVCDGTDLPRPINEFADVRAFAFDARGRPLAGWPVLLRPAFAGGMVGDELTVLSWQRLTDAVPTGVVSHEVWVTTAAADGSIASGTRLPRVQTCCGESWGVAPDGVVYSVFTVGERDGPGFVEVSQVTALDLSGERTGWPVDVDGIASGPAFLPSGQALLTVGSYDRRTSHVLVIDRDGEAASARSAELPIATGALFERGIDGPYECGVPSPRPPVVAHDGTIYVTSEIDTAVYALDASLESVPGWPYSPASSRVYRFNPRSELSCGSFAIPAVGADGTLYLPLQAGDETIGGSLTAVGRDGLARPGWPVELERPGAEFWSVVVGSDGTVFALAVEPEAGDTSSASILAIAPDSTVRSITTILEP
jgi:PQQ-like domain